MIGVSPKGKTLRHQMVRGKELSAMTKTILITGSTDGIGLEAAKVLAGQHHNVLLHGRSNDKLRQAEALVRASGGDGEIETYRADLSSAPEIDALAAAVAAGRDDLDVLINNAGVFRTSNPIADNGLDLRFMVNTIAPYLLSRELKPLLHQNSRIINLSSAAQAPVDLAALRGDVLLDDGNAYAQSKLALTMWSKHLAQQSSADGPLVVAVNPGSFLGTKMVKEAYGMAGNDIGIGAAILAKAATSEEFINASGRYFDNDSGRFADPHADALDPRKNVAVVESIESTLNAISN